MLAGGQTPLTKHVMHQQAWLDPFLPVRVLDKTKWAHEGPLGEQRPLQRKVAKFCLCIVILGRLNHSPFALPGQGQGRRGRHQALPPTWRGGLAGLSKSTARRGRPVVGGASSSHTFPGPLLLWAGGPGLMLSLMELILPGEKVRPTCGCWIETFRSGS